MYIGICIHCSRYVSFLEILWWCKTKQTWKKKTTEERTEQNQKRWKEYEAKRPERKFLNSWKHNRPWLSYENGVMTCSICKSYYQSVSSSSNLKGKNAFIEGSKNLKLSTIQDHEACKGHLSAVQNTKAKASTAIETLKSDSGKALMMMKSAERHRLVHLFRNAHAVGKNGRPLRDYTWLCQCTAANGVDIGKTYLNEKSALVFLSYISDAERDRNT